MNHIRRHIWARRFAVVMGLSVSLYAAMVSPAAAADDTVAPQKPHHTIKKVKKTRVSAAIPAGKHAVVQARAKRGSVVRVAASAPDSVGDQLGLRRTPDPLKLSANAALVIDQNTNEVLLSKNDKAVMPIASLTKLMTGMLVADAKLPMDEQITITQDDVDTYKGTGSRLTVGTTLTRGELLHLALMSSENRAAHALARTYPGGTEHFVQLMNQQAAQLGMRDTRYIEPTGLSSDNRSCAHDLALLVQAAYQRPLLRELTTSPSYTVEAGRRQLQFHNSNRLVANPSWDINLQKTGFINEAGRCLVMSVKLAGREVIMVFLDAAGQAARVADAQRVRRWVESVVQSKGHEVETHHAG